jgi:hypothetical protein
MREHQQPPQRRAMPGSLHLGKEAIEDGHRRRWTASGRSQRVAAGRGLRRGSVLGRWLGRVRCYGAGRAGCRDAHHAHEKQC